MTTEAGEALHKFHGRAPEQNRDWAGNADRLDPRVPARRRYPRVRRATATHPGAIPAATRLVQLVHSFPRRNVARVFVLVFGAWLCGHAYAVTWDELSGAQRDVLSRYQAQWPNLTSEQQTRLAAGAQRWADMDPAQRRQMQQRFGRWQSLSPTQQAELTQRFRNFQSLSPTQQQRLRQRLERFAKLPPEQQQRLRDRFRALSPEQRAQAFDRMRGDTAKQPHDATALAPERQQ
jgi:Protein of unknown function (DUF3106)